MCLIRAPQNEVTKFVIRCRPEQKDINLDILGAPALALSGIRGRKPSEWASKTPSSILSPQRRPNKRHQASKGHFDACLKRRIALSGDPTHLVLSIVYPHFVKDVSGSAHTLTTKAAFDICASSGQTRVRILILNNRSPAGR